MPVALPATRLYLGATSLSAIYRGDTKVWPPGGAVVYTDDFNRADGAIGSGWTGGWAVSGNKAARSSGSEFAMFNQDIGSPDHYAEVDVNITGYMVVNVRRNGLNHPDGYLGFIDPGTGHTKIGGMLGGYHDLVEGSTSHSVSGALHRLRLEAEGSALRLFVDDVLDISTTSTEYLTGNHVGLNTDVGDPSYDNFECGPL